MPEKHHQNLYFLQLQNLSSGYIFSGNITVIGKVDQSFKSVPRRELQWSWNSAVIKHNRIKFIPLLKASNLSKEGTEVLFSQRQKVVLTLAIRIPVLRSVTYC